MQMALGHCHLIGKDWDGKQIAVDYGLAKLWLEKAYACGVRTAAFLLGTMYEDGLGLAQDIEKAIALYEDAAQTDHFYALLNLARIFASGKGIQPDPLRAVHWYKKLIEQEQGIEPTIHEKKLRECITEARTYVAAHG